MEKGMDASKTEGDQSLSTENPNVSGSWRWAAGAGIAFLGCGFLLFLVYYLYSSTRFCFSTALYEKDN